MVDVNTNTRIEDVISDYYLERVGPNNVPLYIPLNGNEFVLGREMCLSPHISRRHASFQKSVEGMWFIKDLSSLNGIFKNKKKLTTECLHPLLIGDHISFGVPQAKSDKEFEFVFCKKESGAAKINPKEEPLDEAIALENGIIHALNDLENLEERTVVANTNDYAKRSLFDAFHIPRESTSSKDTISPKPSTSAVKNNTESISKGEADAEKLVFSNSSSNVTLKNDVASKLTKLERENRVASNDDDDDDDIEIICEGKFTIHNSKLNLEPRPSSVNIGRVESQYFKKENSHYPADKNNIPCPIIDLEDPIEKSDKLGNIKIETTWPPIISTDQDSIKVKEPSKPKNDVTGNPDPFMRSEPSNAIKSSSKTAFKSNVDARSDATIDNKVVEVKENLKEISSKRAFESNVEARLATTTDNKVAKVKENLKDDGSSINMELMVHKENVPDVVLEKSEDHTLSSEIIVEKDMNEETLIQKALTNNCSIQIERLPENKLPKPQTRKLQQMKKLNSHKRRRIIVIDTSDSENDNSDKEILKPIDNLDQQISHTSILDFENVFEDDGDEVNLNYSQMDDVILISDDDDKISEHVPKLIKIETVEQNEFKLPSVDPQERTKISDQNDFFPILSQNFYEGLDEDDEETILPKTSLTKKTTSVKFCEAQVLKSRPKFLCGRGEWVKKPMLERKAAQFYSKTNQRSPIRKPPPNKLKKPKMDLKSMVQANMGHRIPCPGGGSAIRKEAKNFQPITALSHNEKKQTNLPEKRKLASDDPSLKKSGPDNEPQKKMLKTKVTTSSRMDKMIADAIPSKPKGSSTHPAHRFNNFKIPKRPSLDGPTLKSPKTTSSINETVKNSSFFSSTNQTAEVIVNREERKSPQTMVADSKPGNIVRRNSDEDKSRKKIRFADIAEHSSSSSKPTLIKEAPKIVCSNSLRKSNLKPIKVTSEACASNINITPHHNYDPDKYLALILKWNVKWLEEQKITSEPPPVIRSDKMLRQVSSHYNTIDDHFKTYFPLVILETWQHVYRDWSEKLKLKDFQPSFVTTNFDDGLDENGLVKKVLGEIVLESIIEYQHLDQISMLKEGMLIIFDMRIVNANNPNDFKWSPTFGYVSSLQCTLFNPKLNQNAILSTIPAARKPLSQHITLVIKLRPRGASPKWDKKLHIEPVSYLRPIIRQVDSLTNLHKSSLAKLVLTPQYSVMNISVYPQEKFVAINQYNSSQTKAIMGAAYAGLLPESTPKLVLLQGPPGTGKTHTCIGLIQQLLYGKGSVPEGNRRLLVLAPSNAAVDEITRRLITLKKILKTTNPSRKLNFVRVGQVESMHSEIKEFSLDEIVVNTLKDKEKKHEEDLVEKIHNLESKIHSTNTVISSKIAKNCSVSRENDNVSQLHSEIKKLEARKVQLNKSTINFSKKDPRTKHLILNLKKQTIMDCDIILTTLTSCRQSIIDNVFGTNYKHPSLKFTCCIVDEASQCCEPELLLPLQYSISKLILIGDPQQLPATVLSPKAARYNFQKSIFERFFDYYKNKESPIVMLNEQYRMHSEICSFPSKYFYRQSLFTFPRVDKAMENFPLKPYVVFDITDSQESNVQLRGSFQNDKEVKIVQMLCREIGKIVADDCSIGVITPYQGQRKLFIRSFGSSLGSVEVNTVDGFQGREKDVTIMSCVRANDEQTIGFLKCPQRLNVAITRACKCLIICGHLDSLSNHTHWKTLIEDARIRKVVFKINSSDRITKIVRCLMK